LKLFSLKRYLKKTRLKHNALRVLPLNLKP
jgi:hypothetical protein